ncbi:MAG TPA: hypothetical protein VII53_00260 [Solirubrobacteraceae bacterium]
MSPRRLILAVLVSVSVLACALVGGAGSAEAATTHQIGSFGNESGQFNRPHGVAVGPAGDLYIAEAENNRVSRFDSSEHFQFAWGSGVTDGLNEPETCTTACRRGNQSTIAGGFEFPAGVATDAAGDVYVVDWLHSRIEKFDPEGHFLLMFGGQVNETKDNDPKATQAEKNVCTAASGDTCTIGTLGTGDGEFSFWFTLGNLIGVGPGGDVYVGDSGRVQVFEPTGAWKENLSLASVSSEEVQPTALAVNATGDVFLSALGVEGGVVEGVRELEPNGTEKKTQFDVGSTSVSALAVGEGGDLYVADSSGGFHVLLYSSAGTELASFGSNTVSGASDGLAFSPSSGELYASESEESEKASVWALVPPPPGPLVDSQTATPGPAGAATLEAQVNPEGNETSYHFEYVDETDFLASGYTAATSTPPASIGSSFEDQHAIAELTNLTPGETYHWRVVATDSATHTTTGADESFEETPAALIEGPWTEDVASTSATLAVKINPLKAKTSYRLEYGTTIPYEHVITGDVGEGAESVVISRHVQELEPATTYHFRVVTSSLIGTIQGADHTFATEVATLVQPTLPDGRSWELVSPANMGGSVIAPFTYARQAASDGSAITYPVHGAPLGENAASNSSFAGSETLSSRGPGSWHSQDINQPISPPVDGELGGLILGAGTHYALFSSDLASAVVEPPSSTVLSAEGLEGTPYLGPATDTGYAPLITPSNTPPGTELETSNPPEFFRATRVGAAAATPDLGHIVLASQLKLTEDAIQFGTGADSGSGNLYEWGSGRLQLINRLPGTNQPTEPGGSPVELAGEASTQGQVQRVISNDGRWIAWTRGNPYSVAGRELYKGLYLRDTVAEKSVELGGHGARYQTMSSDGSRVFFLESGELYEYNTATETQTDLTATHGAGEASAGVRDTVSDVSEDGSYVYFVAKGQLAEGAVSGEDNLYLLHEVDGTWTTSLIATLSAEDEPSWNHEQGASPEFDQPELRYVSSRVSPSGRYLTFMSGRTLTGYDNIDANSLPGEPRHDVEVYLYDASTARLVCASCDPSGERPVGVFTGRDDLFVEPLGNGPWSQLGHPHWLAASLPGWLVNTGHDTAYQPRYLSDSGRLFFNSPNALVPHDTNGLEDVYQYEPPGTGSCTPTAATFSARSDGCVDAISSGTSATESAFMDASETGNDVFFVSSDKLTGADNNTGYHLWDAHVCSTVEPCISVPASPPPCSSGDSCKPAPSSQPELFGPAPSATFSGAGNFVPASPAAPRPDVSRSLTQAQKLAKALKACKKRKRKQRVTCERKAHRQFAPKQAHKAKAIKRSGNR